MAVTRSKTWISGEVLFASDLNAEFDNVLDNGGSLAWPSTANKDLNGFKFILDSDADTSIQAATDDRIDFEVGGQVLFRFDGTVATPVNGFDFIATAAGTDLSLQAVGSDTDIGIKIIPKGTGATTLRGVQIDDTSFDHQYILAVSELTADRTITLPLLTGNDTLVFNSFAATLTNKTLTSPIVTSPVWTTPQLNDTSADHQYIFAVSELSADRTVTWPLLTGNDELVFKDHIVTMAGKTLTSPVLDTQVTGTAVLDEDDLVSDSATQIATQQSIKAYADSVTGNLVQVVETEDATYQSISSVISIDDSIPVKTEGTEIFTLAITPNNTANILTIHVLMNLNTATTLSGTLALFQDDVTNAIAAWGVVDTLIGPYHVVHKMAAGTTSSTTFKVRLGVNSSSIRVNGTSGRVYGGVMVSRLWIEETKP